MKKLFAAAASLALLVTLSGCSGLDSKPKSVEASITTPPAGWVWLENASGKFKVAFPIADPQEQSQDINENDIRLKNHLFIGEFGEANEDLGKSNAIMGYLEFADESQVSSLEMSLFEEQFFKSFISSFVSGAEATELSRTKYTNNGNNGYDVEAKMNEHDRKLFMRVFRFGKSFYYQAVGLNGTDSFNHKDFFNSLTVSGS